MADSKRFVITLNSERPFDQVIRELRDAGLDVEQSLRDIGVVTGTTRAAAHKFNAIAGVADVSEERSVSVGPPGSKRTW